MEAPQAPAAAQPDLQQQLDGAQATVAQLQHQVQQQQQQLQTAHAQHAALHQQMQQVQQVAYQLAAQQANAANPPPAARNQAAEALLRIPAEQFDGRRANKHLRAWIADLEMRFSVMQPAPSDADKLAYASALLTRGAKDWFLRRQHLLLTWMDFTDALTLKYQPLNQEDHAVDKLQNLKHTSSVAAYCSTFNDLVMELPAIHDKVLTRMYVNGLQPRLRALVKSQCANMNLEEVQCLADQLEEAYLEERHLNRGIHANSSVRPPLPRHLQRYRPHPVHHREGPAPMELGARQLYRQPRLAPSNRRFARVNDNTRRVLGTAPTCPHCRRPGHTADQCPARNARPPGRPPYQGNGQRRRH